MQKITLSIIIATLALYACKKSKTEEPAPAAPTVVGLWKGKFSLTLTSPLNQDVIYYFKSNGTMNFYNGTDTATATQKGSGIWSSSPSLEKSLQVLSEYYYSTSPNVGFSMTFIADSTLTTTITQLNQVGLNAWGTGAVISNQNSFVRRGIIFLSK